MTIALYKSDQQQQQPHDQKNCFLHRRQNTCYIYIYIKHMYFAFCVKNRIYIYIISVSVLFGVPFDEWAFCS